MKTSIRTLTAIAAGALVSSASLAAPITRTSNLKEVSYTMEYARSDLESATGAKQVYSRLRTLALRACAEASDPMRNAMMFETQKCAAKALDGALKQIDSPVLDELHFGKTAD